jgi:hypothetical protein
MASALLFAGGFLRTIGGNLECTVKRVMFPTSVLFANTPTHAIATGRPPSGI